MSIRIHAIQHVPFEDLGSIGSWADQVGIETSLIRIFDNDSLPPREDVTHLIVLGGPMGVHDEDRFPWLVPEKKFIQGLIGSGKRVLGICLGAQLIADALGARVYPNRFPEIGWFPIRKSAQAQGDARADFLPASLDVFHWHGDTFDMPPHARCLASSDACRHQGFLLNERVMGLQFHLETTRQGMQDLLENCAAELVEGRYIQTAADIQAGAHHLARNQMIMAALLNQWIAA
jgi:GMP synthase (glutamine-hydrolysing)